MPKKLNQWLIDRAFNFDYTNENKIKCVLENIYKSQIGEIEYVEAVENMVKAGATTKFERYERSTQTLFKSYGLLSSKNSVTNISKKFIDGTINFKELALIQGFKKQFINNTSFLIRPLIIALTILYKAHINEKTNQYAWLDVYDYMNILTEIKSYEDINVLYEKFIQDKNLSEKERQIDEIQDCDIWFNFFVTTGLFEKTSKAKYSVCLNIEEIDLIKFIIDNHEKAPLITEGDDWICEFCKDNNGIISIIPIIETNGYDELDDVSYELKKQVLYYTLIDGIPPKLCDDLIFQNIGQNSITSGLFTRSILQSYGIKVSKQDAFLGIYKPFKNYIGLLKLLPMYEKHNELVEALIESVKDLASKNFIGMHITSKNSALELDNPHVCIGWSALGDLSNVKDKESLVRLYVKAYGDGNKRAMSQNISQIWLFIHEMRVGDYVVFYDGKMANIGSVSTIYYYNKAVPNQDLDYVNNKGVKWLKSIPYYDLPGTLKNAAMATRSIFSLNNYKAEILALLNKQYKIDEYKLEEEKKKMVKRNPRLNKDNPMNMILYGAPGTGKTFATVEYALAILNNKRIEDIDFSTKDRDESMAAYNSYIDAGRIVFTTFHQSYGYEDFIQGLRLDTSSDKVSFKTVDGVFKQIADRAMQDLENDYVIIIDEINRANISKVFGELITLIEDDKRWGEKNAICITLPFGEKFAVPNNLYIVGTMNSADKSISLIDTALRRRFEFVEVVPNYALIEDDFLQVVLETLNDTLINELNSADLLIGHAYFINKTIDDLDAIMNRSIIPLLYEYFYDNSKKVKEIVKKAIDGLNFDVKDIKVGRISIVKKGE